MVVWNGRFLSYTPVRRKSVSTSLQLEAQIDLAGGHGAVAGEVLVHEPLVVAQVQVRLGPVLGDEHLAVLIGTHSPRVHIDIGVELLVPHPDAPLLQKPPQGGRADPLAQAGDHAAGNEYEFR